MSLDAFLASMMRADESTPESEETKPSFGAPASQMSSRMNDSTDELFAFLNEYRGESEAHFAHNGKLSSDGKQASDTDGEKTGRPNTLGPSLAKADPRSHTVDRVGNSEAYGDAARNRSLLAASITREKRLVDNGGSEALRQSGPLLSVRSTSPSFNASGRNRSRDEGELSLSMSSYCSSIEDGSPLKTAPPQPPSPGVPISPILKETDGDCHSSTDMNLHKSSNTNAEPAPPSSLLAATLQRLASVMARDSLDSSLTFQENSKQPHSDSAVESGQIAVKDVKDKGLSSNSPKPKVRTPTGRTSRSRLQPEVTTRPEAKNRTSSAQSASSVVRAVRSRRLAQAESRGAKNSKSSSVNQPNSQSGAELGSTSEAATRARDAFGRAKNSAGHDWVYVRSPLMKKVMPFGLDEVFTWDNVGVTTSVTDDEACDDVTAGSAIVGPRLGSTYFKHLMGVAAESRLSTSPPKRPVPLPKSSSQPLPIPTSPARRNGPSRTPLSSTARRRDGAGPLVPYRSADALARSADISAEVSSGLGGPRSQSQSSSKNTGAKEPESPQAHIESSFKTETGTGNQRGGRPVEKDQEPLAADAEERHVDGTAIREDRKERPAANGIAESRLANQDAQLAEERPGTNANETAERTEDNESAERPEAKKSAERLGANQSAGRPKANESAERQPSNESAVTRERLAAGGGVWRQPANLDAPSSPGRIRRESRRRDDVLQRAEESVSEGPQKAQTVVHDVAVTGWLREQTQGQTQGTTTTALPQGRAIANQNAEISAKTASSLGDLASLLWERERPILEPQGKKKVSMQAELERSATASERSPERSGDPPPRLSSFARLPQKPSLKRSLRYGAGAGPTDPKLHFSPDSKSDPLEEDESAQSLQSPVSHLRNLVQSDNGANTNTLPRSNSPQVPAWSDRSGQSKSVSRGPSVVAVGASDLHLSFRSGSASESESESEIGSARPGARDRAAPSWDELPEQSPYRGRHGQSASKKPSVESQSPTNESSASFRGVRSAFAGPRHRIHRVPSGRSESLSSGRANDVQEEPWPTRNEFDRGSAAGSSFKILEVGRPLTPAPTELRPEDASSTTASGLRVACRGSSQFLPYSPSQKQDALLKSGAVSRPKKKNRPPLRRLYSWEADPNKVQKPPSPQKDDFIEFEIIMTPKEYAELQERQAYLSSIQRLPSRK